MTTEILRLVFDYSKRGKLADKAFIAKVVEYTVKEKDLHDYVRELKFGKLKDTTIGRINLAGYDIIGYKLLVDLDIVYQILEETLTEVGYMFNAIEPMLYKNLNVVQVIRHELQHAAQLKQATSSRNDFETRLLNVCLEDVIALHDPKVQALVDNGDVDFQELLNYSYGRQIKQKQFYRQNPTERLAQIDSYGMIIDCLNQIKNYTPNILMVEYEFLLLELLRGYSYQDSQLEAPTPVFLKGMSQYDFFKKQNFYDEDNEALQKKVEKGYTLEKRLRLGLPIRKEEYDKVRSRITLL